MLPRFDRVFRQVGANLVDWAVLEKLCRLLPDRRKFLKRFVKSLPAKSLSPAGGIEGKSRGIQVQFLDTSLTEGQREIKFSRSARNIAGDCKEVKGKHRKC